ncbi:hypothetical protein L1987_08903 [Smallanthus sonchifolius]|uniref:Uncharacterized protein n=1 Tax=Smallanthus sonchifolius TaxID=185202 RepID=A0ACB9JPG7_9ASTR|nr:hypothetical protein L1987_08903 [Smallanthus sonchifolius]
MGSSLMIFFKWLVYEDKSEHEEHMSHNEPEQFTQEPTVREAIAEEVGLVLQATLPNVLSKALQDSKNELKELLNEGNPGDNPNKVRRRHYESECD